MNKIFYKIKKYVIESDFHQSQQPITILKELNKSSDLRDVKNNFFS